MKKLISVCVLVIALSLLSACSASPAFAQRVIELPSPIQIAILSLVTFLVGYVFTRIAELFPPLAEFLGQYVDEVSVAVAGVVVMSIQAWLNAVPPQWEGAVNAALALLVAVLAAIGLFKTLRKARVPGFRH